MSSSSSKLILKSKCGYKKRLTREQCVKIITMRIVEKKSWEAIAVQLKRRVAHIRAELKSASPAVSAILEHAMDGPTTQALKPLPPTPTTATVWHDDPMSPLSSSGMVLSSEDTSSPASSPIPPRARLTRVNDREEEGGEIVEPNHSFLDRSFQEDVFFSEQPCDEPDLFLV